MTCTAGREWQSKDHLREGTGYRHNMLFVEDMPHNQKIATLDSNLPGPFDSPTSFAWRSMYNLLSYRQGEHVIAKKHFQVEIVSEFHFRTFFFCRYLTAGRPLPVSDHLKTSSTALHAFPVPIQRIEDPAALQQKRDDHYNLQHHIGAPRRI